MYNNEEKMTKEKLEMWSQMDGHFQDFLFLPLVVFLLPNIWHVHSSTPHTFELLNFKQKGPT